MDKYPQDRIDANREAWNASAPHHLEGARYRHLLEGFKTRELSNLDDLLTEQLKALGLAGKDVAQLCYNNGSEFYRSKT